MNRTACSYCGAPTERRPYAHKNDGVPSVTAIAESLDAGRSRRFAWAASGIAASCSVHQPERWQALEEGPCDPDEKAFCPRCAFVRSEFDRRWKAKADLGTHIHHLALSWCQGEDIDVDARSAPYVDAIEKMWIETDPEWLLLEQTVLYDRDSKWHRYRGTLDFVAKLTVDGVRSTYLADWKTSGDLWPTSMNLQLCAYRYATSLTSWESGKEEVIGPMPKVDFAGIVLLSPNGTYRLAVMPATRDDHGVFIRLVDAWHYERRMASWARRELVDD